MGEQLTIGMSSAELLATRTPRWACRPPRSPGQRDAAAISKTHPTKQDVLKLLERELARLVPCSSWTAEALGPGAVWPWWAPAPPAISAEGQLTPRGTFQEASRAQARTRGHGGDGAGFRSRDKPQRQARTPPGWRVLIVPVSLSL